jgi:hypothetical protein
MHIFDLLYPLSGGPDVEIIRAFLPHWLMIANDVLIDLTGKSFFHHSHNYPGIARLGLRYQQMKVFGHGHASVHDEAVFSWRLFQDSDEQIAPLGRA